MLYKRKFVVVGLACLHLLMHSCSNKATHQRPANNGRSFTSIYLLPYQGFDTSLIAGVQTAIAKHFLLPTTVMDDVALPANAWQPARKRYQADSLLRFQQQLAATNNGIIIGLTNRDVAIAKGHIKSWGVFGVGYCPGKACVISTKRLQQPGTSKTLLAQRLQKVVLHELGHNWGLPHCQNQLSCLMNDAKAKLSTIDAEQLAFCPKCKHQLLQYNTTLTASRQ